MISLTAKYAYEKGYRVIGNEVFNTKTGNQIKLSYTSDEDKRYPCFGFSYKNIKTSCRAHQLCAWEKFGENCMGDKIEIRHLDDNKLNFRKYNIVLGTKLDNMIDKRKNKFKNQVNLFTEEVIYENTNS